MHTQLSNRAQKKDRALYLICSVTYHCTSARSTGHYEDESVETVFDIPAQLQRQHFLPIGGNIHSVY